MVHAPPRKLKMGKAVSRNTKSVGRGIVAGCKRSQSMAKAYTNRSVDKLRRSFIAFLPTKIRNTRRRPKQERKLGKKAHFKGGIRVFQHVDDLTQMMWAKNEAELANRGYNSVGMWAQEVRMALHMRCSDKNVIIPEGVPASIVQRALLEERGQG